MGSTKPSPISSWMRGGTKMPANTRRGMVRAGSSAVAVAAATAPKSIVVRGGGAAACVLACTRLNVSLSAALNRTASTLSTPAAGVKTAPGCMMTKLATPGSEVTISTDTSVSFTTSGNRRSACTRRITGLGVARASLDGQVVTDAAGLAGPCVSAVRLRLRRDWLELGRLKHRRSVHDGP